MTLWFALVDDHDDPRAFVFSSADRAVTELIDGWGYDTVTLTTEEPDLSRRVLRSTDFLDCTSEELYWQEDRKNRERAHRGQIR